MTRDNDVPVPFFSGLCLEGEVAGQYELEISTAPASAASRDSEESPTLPLDGLGPITIFVGANNSGKSRLMREFYKTLEPALIALGGIETDEYLPSSHIQDWQTSETPSEPSKNHTYAEEVEELYKTLESGYSSSPRQSTPPSRANVVQSSRQRTDSLHTTWLSPRKLEALDYHLNEIGKTLQASPLRGSIAIRGSTAAREVSIFQNMQKWRTRYLKLRSEISRIYEFKVITRSYIPMLRGMRPPLSEVNGQAGSESIQSDIYRDRTVFDYFENLLSESGSQASSAENLSASSHYLKHEQLHIFTGLGLYADLQDRMLSPEQEKRQSIIAYQQFLSDHFFAGQPVLLVPALKKHGSGGMNDVVYIKIGDKADYPIHELGDGMQSLIICTYPIVTETRRGCLFFLEEPDLCMHPSLQRTFLEVLKHYHRSMGHQFFLTTHSNHLLDLVDDPDLVSVLSFSEISGNNSNTSSSKREPEDSDHQASAPAKFRIRQAKRQDRDLLNQLGVRPSATFLANATIWVEGISDVAYLRVYMEAFLHYLKHWGGEAWQATASQLSAYKEDNHYAFVEYSGANLTHLIFTTADQDVGDVAKPQDQQPSTDVCSLCGHAIVIADGDITDNRKGKRAEAFLAQLGERLIILPGKEVENLIPEDYAKKQVDDDHNGKGRCGIVSPESIDKISYSKYRQWRSNGKLTGLGDYLNHLEIEKYRPSKSSGSQGTLPATYKQRWRSTSQGIPRKIREALKAEPGQNVANSEDASKAPPSLPDYMTRDLIWLCTCIYSHIAECNHHEEAHRHLSDLLEWMLDSKDCHSEPLSTECGETAEAMLDAWPIHNPCARECVLQSYATKAPLTS